jgi:glycolate dehydrogenase FAD-binding subunit
VSVTARALAGTLAAVVGAEGVRDDPAALGAAAIDGLTPRWLVAPSTAEQVAQLLTLAHEEQLAVVPRGSGAALEQGGPPRRVDLILDLRRLHAVVEHNPDDLTISVQAGMTAGALAARLEAHRQALPLDPPGWSTRTLGGIAATQASGPLRMRYGTMRDLLLGVRFVQADGVLTWGGARVVKSVTGYDVPKLMVGALGTLGVLVELTLRLHPVPDVESSSLLMFRSPAAAQEMVARLLDSSVQPNRLEMLDDRALAACGLPVAAAALAISIATVEPAVRAQEAALAALVIQAGGRLEPLGGSFWHLYDRTLAAPGVTLRIGTVPSRLAATFDEIRGALGAAAVSGCAALGALRARVDGGDVTALARGIERLRGFVADGEGGVMIERGPRSLRAAIDPWGPVPGPALAVMRAIKHEFDPAGVLNPGRFVDAL